MRAKHRQENRSDAWRAGRWDGALSGSRYLKPPALPEVADIIHSLVDSRNPPGFPVGYSKRLPILSFFRNSPLSAHIRNFPPGAGRVQHSPPEFSTISAPAAMSHRLMVRST